METNNVKSPSEEITITGRLGGDPKKAVLKNSHAELSKFSVAVHKKDEDKPKWYDVAAFGDLMEAADKLKQGSFVTIKGELKVKTVGEGKDVKEFLNVTAKQIINRKDQVLKGNLAQDAVYKDDAKVPVIEIVIAEPKENENDKAKFHKIAFFNQDAIDLKAQDLKKGDFVSILGHESTKLNAYEKEGGKKVVEAQTQFLGQDLKVLSKAADRAAKKESSQSMER